MTNESPTPSPGEPLSPVSPLSQSIVSPNRADATDGCMTRPAVEHVPDRRGRRRIRWALAIISLGAAAIFLFLMHRHNRQAELLAALPRPDVANLERPMGEIIGQYLDRVIAVPSSGPAWGHYGSVLLAQDFVLEAAACYAIAEQLEPREFRWPYLRGCCLERTEPEVALDCFRRASLESANHVTPHVHYAELLLNRGELEQVSAPLQRAAGLATNDARVAHAMGRLALQQNRVPAALHWANQAVQIEPFRKKIHLLLSQIHQRMGNEAALDGELRMLEVLPDTDWPDPILGEIAQYKRSTSWVLQVVESLLSEGRVRDALMRLERLGGEDSDDIRVLVLLGKAYMRGGDLVMASQLLAKAVAQDPNRAPAHIELGNLALVQGRFEEAISNYQRAIEIEPSIATTYYNLGLCYRELDRRDEAIAAFELTCRYMPHNFPAHRDAGELLLEADRFEEAVRHLELAARLAPQDRTIRTLLERARAAAIDERDVLPTSATGESDF